MPQAPDEPKPTVVLHPKLQVAADKLLKMPGLTQDTIRRIKFDLHMDRPEPEQLSLDVTDDI